MQPLDDEVHRGHVERVQGQLHQLHANGQAFRIQHGRKALPDENGEVVDITPVCRVLDRCADTVTVEGATTMHALLEDCLKAQRMPLVTIENPLQTVGGAFCSANGGSTSFRHGLFHETVTAIEVLFANGKYCILTKDESPDFYRFLNSCGGLGIVIALDIRVQRTLNYVKLTYQPVASVADAKNQFDELSQDQATNFLEGIMFAPDAGVVCRGELASKKACGALNKVLTPHAELEYLQLLERQEISTTRFEEATSVASYIFRYGKDATYTRKLAFEVEQALPQGRIGRLIACVKGTLARVFRSVAETSAGHHAQALLELGVARS